MQKLARLRRDNATWSVVEVLKCNGEIEHAFGSLDPNLANLIHDGNSLQFGVRYGKKVEVEYEVTVPSSVSAQAIPNSSMQFLVSGSRKEVSLLPHLDLTADGASVRGVVKVEMTRYAAWLAECARSSVNERGN
jgi:hypothetical protein